MCLQVLKEQEDSDFLPEYCDAGIVFYRNAPQMGYAYGVIVLSPPPEGDLEPYQVGDVLVSVEGEPVYTAETYSALRETYPEGYQAGYTAIRDCFDPIIKRHRLLPWDEDAP